MKHLIFFDAECSLCQKMVQNLLQIDKTALFSFAPLNGATAQKEFTGKYAPLKDKDSIVLLENFRTPEKRFWIRSRAIFRIFWLLGGKWRLIGWFYQFPFGTDLVYMMVARHRHLATGKPSKVIPFEHADRFLP